MVIRSAASPVRARPGLAVFCRKPTTSVRVKRVVADDRESVEHQAAVEQVGLHPLGRQRGLPDRDIADQRLVRHQTRHPRHGVSQSGVQGEPQSMSEDALMHGGDTGGEGERRCRVKYLAHREVVEVGTRHSTSVCRAARGRYIVLVPEVDTAATAAMA